VIVEVGEISDRVGEGDGQLASGVHIAEQNVGRCGAAFLAEVLPFKNRCNVLGDVVDGKRPTVDEKHDCRCTGFEHSFHQAVLHAEKVEGIAIAQMLLRPSLAIGGFVFTDDEDGNVGTFGRVDGFLNFLALSCRVDQFSVVFEPSVPVLLACGELAALRIHNLRFCAYAIANTLRSAATITSELPTRTKARARRTLPRGEPGKFRKS
jgi:hypothetical protein